MTERWRTEKISTGPFNFRQSEQLSAALKTSFIISLILYFLKIKLFWAVSIPDVNFSWNPCFITKTYFYFLGIWSWEISDGPKKILLELKKGMSWITQIKEGRGVHLGVTTGHKDMGIMDEREGVICHPNWCFVIYEQLKRQTFRSIFILKLKYVKDQAKFGPS